jgi:hypothetical protein
VHVCFFFPFVAINSDYFTVENYMADVCRGDMVRCKLNYCILFKGLIYSHLNMLCNSVNKTI